MAARKNRKLSHERKQRKLSITNLIAEIEASWKEKDKKPHATLADFIRLTQLESEFEEEEEQPEEIVIRWADPGPTRNTGR
jgi:predicted DNA-binding ribbon-helix-helix protein